MLAVRATAATTFESPVIDKSPLPQPQARYQRYPKAHSAAIRQSFGPPICPARVLGTISGLARVGKSTDLPLV